MGKVYQLNRKLTLPTDTVTLVRAQVDSINGCTWCADAGRWYAMKNAPHSLPKLDALHEYRTSPLFSDKKRAALDFAAELTEQKHVTPKTFSALSRYYSEREICEIVWLVSSNHLFNINNLGLGIGSDGFCELIQHRAINTSTFLAVRRTRPPRHLADRRCCIKPSRVVGAADFPSGDSRLAARTREPPVRTTDKTAFAPIPYPRLEHAISILQEVLRLGILTNA
jgi:hypothetical protein